MHRRRLSVIATVVPVAAGAALAAGVLGAASRPRLASATTGTPRLPQRVAAGSARAASAGRGVAALTAETKSWYDEQVDGPKVQRQLRRVARDQVLLRALEHGDLRTLRAEAWRQQRLHAVGGILTHISCLEVFRGSHRVVEVGVPFCVAGSRTTLRGAHGKLLGTLLISVQDEIGVVRYMHRNHPVDVVIRGAGGEAVSSLPAALYARLPTTGMVRISGRALHVRSFHRFALDDEPVTVWVLAPA